MDINNLIYLINKSIYVNPIIIRLSIAFIIIAFGLLLRKIIVRGIVSVLMRIAKKTKTEIDEIIISALERPAQVFILGLTIYLAIAILGLPAIIQTISTRVFRTFFIVIIFWFFYRSADSVSIFVEGLVNKTDKKASPVLTELFRKSIRFAIVVIEVFMIIKEWGFDITGLITGLGIGGLAISLAAKDAASNFLGSITIMIDKTYDVGDWIQAGDIEGTVEEIGFRSTKIRNFANASISVPNSIMSNESIINWSKMRKRRFAFTFDIPLDTPSDKISLLLSRIRELLENNKEINQEYKAVHLSGFGEASYKILINYFTVSTAYLTYLVVAEEINMNIIKIFEEVGIEILPSQRILVGTLNGAGN